MRLIDANKLGLTDFEIVMCDGDYKEALKLVLSKIGNAPTVDAVPVRHGKWKPYRVRLTRSVKGGMYEKGLRCSQCNYKDGDYEYAYCPNCGTKMNGR